MGSVGSHVVWFSVVGSVGLGRWVTYVCACTLALHMHACAHARAATHRHTPTHRPPPQVFGSLGARRRRAVAGEGAGAAPPAAAGAAAAKPGVLERIGVVQAPKVRAWRPWGWWVRWWTDVERGALCVARQGEWGSLEGGARGKANTTAIPR
jgi:hypothetical protein